MEHKRKPEIFLSLFTLLMLALAMTALISPRPLRKTFALESINVGVYWDDACRWSIEFIDWGELKPGSREQVAVFVRNEEFERSCVLYLDTGDWYPARESDYILLSWDYGGEPVGVQEVVMVTLVLEVSADIEVITDFNFNIVISAIESLNIGIYSDVTCTRRVESVNWGALTPALTSTQTIFVRNEEFERSCVLYLGTGDWYPAGASDYILLSWDYGGEPVGVQEVVMVTLVLEVSADIEVITDFTFNIIPFGIEYISGDIIPFGIEYISGDLNLDGSYDINDFVEFVATYGSTPLSPKWNPRADFDSNNLIEIYDVVLMYNAGGNIE